MNEATSGRHRAAPSQKRRTRAGTTIAGVVVTASLGLLGTGVATAAPVQTSTAVPTPAVAAVEQALGPIQRALGDSVSVGDIRATENPNVSVVDWTVDVDAVHKALGIESPGTDNSLLLSALPAGVDLSKVNVERVLDGKTVPSAVTELSKVGKDTKNSAVVGQFPTIEGLKNPELAKNWSDVIKSLDSNDVVSSIHSAAQSLGVDDVDGAVTELANRLGAIPDLLGKSGEQILDLVNNTDQNAPATRSAALVDTEGAEQVKFSAPINTKATGVESAFGDALRTGADGAASEIDRDRARDQVSDELTRQATPFAGELGDIRAKGLIPDSAEDLGIPKEIRDITIPVVNKTVGQVINEVLDLINGVIDNVTGGSDSTDPDENGGDGDNQGETKPSPLDEMSFNEAMEVYTAVNAALKEQNDKENPSQGGNTNNGGGNGSDTDNSGNGGGDSNTGNGGPDNGNSQGSSSGDGSNNGSTSGNNGGSSENSGSAQGGGETNGGDNGSPQATNSQASNANGDNQIPPPTYNDAAADSLPVTGASSSTPWIAGIAALAVLAGVAAVLRARSLKEE